MDERAMTAALRRYLVTEILEGDGEGLDGRTPLLEWGILNSMEMVRLLAFIGREFGVRILPDEVTPAHFRNIDEIVALVMRRIPEKEPND
jgi:2-hydroxymuconate-semialdehyde hydrolase